MDFPRSSIAVTLLAVVTATLLFKYWPSRKKSSLPKTMKPRVKNVDELKNRTWHCVGKISKLYLYPIKSCAGISIASAEATHRGLKNDFVKDRSFIIVTDKGAMVTGRMIPTTVKIKAQVDNDILTLQFPDASPLSVSLSQVVDNNVRKTATIWGEPDIPGFDCGDEVAEWLKCALGRKCRLLYHGIIPSPRKTDLRDCYPKLRTDDNAYYADLTGFMLMTTESVKDLKERANKKAPCHVEPLNFRPNILIEGTKGPYDEDLWDYIRIGEVIFRNVKPCTRCIFTTINYETGKKDPNMEPLRTLRSYRPMDEDKSPYFGINLGIDITGTLKEGDSVFATYSL